MCLFKSTAGSSGSGVSSVSPANSAAFSFKSLDSPPSTESDSSEESSNSSTTSSKSPPQLSPQNLSVTQNPIYVDLQPNHNGHKDSLLMMTSPQMALLTPQNKENHEMVEEVNKYPNITVKVMSCATINQDKVPCDEEFKAVPFTFCNMSQNIFDLKKKRGRKRKLQNSGDFSLSRSGSCDEPQFDEKIENLNQDQDTIETTLAMMIKTQEITTLTAHHEIIQEESPMHICKPSLEKRQKTIENHQKTIENHQKTIENHQKTIENHFAETEAISSDKENHLNSTNNQGNSSLKSPIKIDHETKVLNNNDKKDFENQEEITIDSDSSDDFHLSIDDEEDSDFESENISNFVYNSNDSKELVGEVVENLLTSIVTINKKQVETCSITETKTETESKTETKTETESKTETKTRIKNRKRRNSETKTNSPICAITRRIPKYTPQLFFMHRMLKILLNQRFFQSGSQVPNNAHFMQSMLLVD